MTRLVHGIVSLDPPTIRCDGCGHEATGRTLAMVVQHSGIEFDPARYLADPRPDPVRDADRIVTTRPPRPATKTS